MMMMMMMMIPGIFTYGTNTCRYSFRRYFGCMPNWSPSESLPSYSLLLMLTMIMTTIFSIMLMMLMLTLTIIAKLTTSSVFAVFVHLYMIEEGYSSIIITKLITFRIFAITLMMLTMTMTSRTPYLPSRSWCSWCSRWPWSDHHLCHYAHCSWCSRWPGPLRWSRRWPRLCPYQVENE